MSSKKKKISPKRHRASEEPTHDYDHEKFVNASAAKKFGLISKNRSFIKEKGYYHPDDFFRKTIVNKGWNALFKPPRPAATMVVREFYANLASHILKRVQVRRVLVDFSAKSINRYYNLESVNSAAYDRLHENPNYPEVLRMLTNGQGEWKLNSEGHAMHFKAKHLAYIPKIWHHFITSRLIPTTNVCEVTAKRALLNYAIIQDISFDVGQVIEDAILYNKDEKMNLSHPFLFYGLFKQAEVPLEDNEARIHPIKAIMIKKDKSGVPRPEDVYDSGNEPSYEDELKAYQSRFGILASAQGEARQSPTQLLPPPPSSEEDPVSPSTTLKDQVHDLIARFDAYWDDTHKHPISISQDMNTLRADMNTMMPNQAPKLDEHRRGYVKFM